MKKRFISLLLVSVMLFVFVLSACGSSSTTATTSSTTTSSTSSSTSTDSTAAASTSTDDGTVYTFKIDYPNPENSAGYVALTEWSEKLAEESNGRLDMQIYANGQLGSIMDCVSNCVGGLTDGFWSALTIYAGSFRAAEAFTLPMMGVNNGDAGSAALTAMLEETDYYTEEFKNLHVVTLHSSTTMPIGFKDSTPITSMSQMAGLNMRVTGGYNSNWVTAIGCNPVSAGSNDGYEYLEKGIINAYLYDWDKIKSGALLEQTGYIIDAHCSASELFFCLNKQKYEALPEDLQQLIDDSAQFFRDRINELFNEDYEALVEQAESMGITVEPISDSLRDELAAAAEDVWASWIEEMNAAGYDGQGIFDATKAYIEQYNEVYPYYN